VVFCNKLFGEYWFWVDRKFIVIKKMRKEIRQYVRVTPRPRVHRWAEGLKNCRVEVFPGH
jgi:chemotaxis signal transduction protein